MGQCPRASPIAHRDDRSAEALWSLSPRGDRHPYPPQAAPAVIPPSRSGLAMSTHSLPAPRVPFPGRGYPVLSARAYGRGAQGEQRDGQQDRGHGCHGQRGHQRGAASLRGSGGGVRAGAGPADPRLVAREDGVGGGRPGLRADRSDRPLRRRRRRRPSGLGLPADARPGDDLAHERTSAPSGSSRRWPRPGSRRWCTPRRSARTRRGPRATRWTSRGRRTAGRMPRTAGRRPIWSGRWTPSNATIRASGWCGCGRPSSSSGSRPVSSADLRRPVPAGSGGSSGAAPVPAGRPRSAGAGPAHGRRGPGLPAGGAVLGRPGRVQPRGRAAGGRRAAGRADRGAPGPAAPHRGPLGGRRRVGDAAAAGLTAPVRRSAAAAAHGLHTSPGGAGLARDAHGHAGAGGVPAGPAAGRGADTEPMRGRKVG
ncbi:hypothetical protein SVIOM342S_08280 [Streptomyces violaceorubidus]